MKKFINIFMKSILLLALCLIISQQAVLIASSTNNTLIQSSSGETTKPFSDRRNSNTIGKTGAIWIYRSIVPSPMLDPNNPANRPTGFLLPVTIQDPNNPTNRPTGLIPPIRPNTIFLARFYADCQSPITLQISADNDF